MPCFHPKRVLLDREGQIVWTDRRPEDVYEARVLVKCGRCLGCRRAVQRDWSVRSFHESLTHRAPWRDADSGVTTELPNSSVITLTYDDDHLPAAGALKHDDFQRFMKRLRIHRVRRYEREKRLGDPPNIRFFMCGEYGHKGRPHYHAIIYGETFGERYLEQSRDGQIISMSYELDQLWSQAVTADAQGEPTKIGRASVDEFSYAGAAYVAGYVMKKAGEEHLGPWHESVDTLTGLVTTRPICPEYRKMSFRPDGLGHDYVVRNLARIYSEDRCMIGEFAFKPPRYYDILLERYRPDLVPEVKRNRQDRMVEAFEEWSPERCSAAEAIEFSRLDSRAQSLS